MKINDDNFADINIISGHFLHNTAIFTDQSPYIAFEYNEKMFNTTVKSNAGLNATWNERFRLKPLKKPNELFFQAFGKKLITDDFIGETNRLKLSDLGLGMTRTELTLWDRKKRKMGRVMIEICM